MTCTITMQVSVNILGHHRRKFAADVKGDVTRHNHFFGVLIYLIDSIWTVVFELIVLYAKA